MWIGWGLSSDPRTQNFCRPGIDRRLGNSIRGFEDGHASGDRHRSTYLRFPRVSKPGLIVPGDHRCSRSRVLELRLVRLHHDRQSFIPFLSDPGHRRTHCLLYPLVRSRRPLLAPRTTRQAEIHNRNTAAWCLLLFHRCRPPGEPKAIGLGDRPRSAKRRWWRSAGLHACSWRLVPTASYPPSPEKLAPSEPNSFGFGRVHPRLRPRRAFGGNLKPRIQTLLLCLNAIVAITTPASGCRLLSCAGEAQRCGKCTVCASGTTLAHCQGARMAAAL